MLHAIEPRLIAKRDAVAALCRMHGVATLDGCGSEADGRFDLLRSDDDFIAHFAPQGDTSLGRPYPP